jgi:hypothetical protein
LAVILHRIAAAEGIFLRAHRRLLLHPPAEAALAIFMAEAVFIAEAGGRSSG